ncbi:MAG: GTPase HflX [Candidatus Margulisbacteria bacterium]|nr:GTPase HflX [Candidatus Margulisiibacteriota bacterium]
MVYRLEKSILVSVELQNQPGVPLRESLAELARLADTAKALVVGILSQKRPRPDLRHFIGKGKLAELQALVAARDANLVIFDAELSASQERNLENDLGVKVVDRTELILDIFAQHARSREGNLQVELAQSVFLLTRLSGQGIHMSRLGGGIGTRGPGETKLESDRRRIRKRISELNKEIEKVRKDRALRRDKRKKSQLPIAALVGYTNSGKSTLLNALTSAGVLVEDKLFATLDTTVRRLQLPGEQMVLITDTVGFIQKLPHQLVAAFRATLEEVTEADLLLHVVDLSHPNFEHQISAVYAVLEELGAVTKPIITIFNKIDCLDNKVPKELLLKYQPAVAISALEGKGL